MMALLFLALAFQAPSPTVSGDHCTATLVADVQSAAPGQEIRVGVKFNMDPKWHIYWINPGDSGLATSIKWDESPNLKFGELQWPAPMRFTGAGAVGYGYEESVLLFSNVRVSEEAKVGDRIRIGADVSWLVCEEACIPGGGKVWIELPITAGEGTPGAAAQDFEKSAARVPKVLQGATATRTERGFVLSLPIEGAGVKSAYFFSIAQEVVSHGADQVVDKSGPLKLSLLRSEYSTREPEVLTGVVLVVGTDGKPKAYRIAARLASESR